MVAKSTKASRLRGLIAADQPTVVPLVLDPMSALLAEASGFKALYLGGGTLGYVKTCTEANLSLTQMSQAAVEIAAASDLPLILDGQCGWGDPMHVLNTVRVAEASGLAGIEIEDQLSPKRAHHHVGIEHLVPTELMVEEIKVAQSARRDPDFVIIGRTNACRSEGVDEALRRGEAYRKAGADVLLILQKRPEEARLIAERLGGPLFYMMLGGVASIGMSIRELGNLGYKLVNDGVTPYYARQRALRLCYEALALEEVDPTIGTDYAAETERMHELIGLDTMLDIERRTVETPS